MENGTLGQDQYDAFTARSLRRSRNYNALQSRLLMQTQPLQRLVRQEGSSNQTGTTITNVGRSLTTKVTAPIAARVAVAVNKYGEVDKTMSLVNGIMGNSEQQAKIQNDAMSELASNSTFGMSDATEASLNFARAGLTSE